MACADLREELNCPICLSIYTSPVMLSCGHNFCRDCIGEVLDSQEGSRVYTCPECRAEFPERPALQRIRKLCNIVERFLSTQPEQEEAVIFCSYCFDSRVAAVKTCLLCDASLCANHLKIHSKSLKHVLVEPTASLENRNCSIHNELLKYQCSEDKAYICGSCCLAGEHKGHQVELLNEASDKKKETLRNVLEKLITKRDETQKRVQMLQEHTRVVPVKAAGIKDKVTALFGDLIEEMKVREKRVLSEVIRQEEQVLLQVSGLIQQLEIEKDELSRKVLDIEKLCNITDPLTVLKGCESVSAECCDAEREMERE
ncbi:E3 ubiquitin/ISG15 ligase TRIM25-like [Ascaphus truei]|uniref:E3 ubiquitin/ISG15 ligase TRIM25-like n=1 Tax=Ascaphus truei TaxID=8439 RepID=UPI003F5A914A